MKKTNTLFKLTGSALLAALISQANASGFAVTTQNTSGLGNAFAGQAALAENATAMWYNPASLAHLERQLSVSAILTSPNSEFTNKTITPLNGDTIVEDAVVPAISFALPISDTTALGLYLSSPFGSKRDYENTFVGLTEASYSEIKTVNLNLALGHKLSDVVSLGVGLNYQTVEADLQKAAPPSGLELSRLEGDDSAIALNIGLQYTPDDKTAFGIAYRSSADFTVEGSVSISPLTGAPAGIDNIPASAKVKMPHSWIFSISHYVTPKAQLLFSTTYTGWDSLEELKVESEDQTTAFILGLSGPERFEWENTMHFALGTNYTYSNDVTLRAGIAYDQTPVPSAALRSLRSPDSSRTWFSVGANYQVNNSLNIDAGYSYVSLKDAKVVRDTFTGSYETDANILGLQANWKF